jgi:hypothetical protein
VTIFLGLNISKMNLGMNGTGVANGWLIWIILMPMILEIHEFIFARRNNKGMGTCEYFDIVNPY